MIRPLLHRYRFEAVLGLLVSISIVARLWKITGFSEDYDEGAHLMQAWLLSQGYQLYREIFFPLPPLLIQPLAWLFQITGPSSLVARLLEVACAGLGLVAIAYIGRKLWNEKVGLLAVILLSLADNYFRLSRISLGNVPALVLSLVTLWCGLKYLEQGRRRWLGLAGLGASLSLLIKPLAVVTPLLLFGLVIARYWSQPHRRLEFWKGILVLGGAFFAPFVVTLFAYDAPLMLEQVVSLRYRSEQVEQQEITANLAMLQEYFTDNPGWMGLALFGLIRARPTQQAYRSLQTQSKLGSWLLLGWLGLTLIPILRFESLHSHHLVMLEPPLALLGALAIFSTVRAITPLRNPGPIGGLGLVLFLFYLGTFPTLLEDRLSDKPRGLDFAETQSRWQAVKMLQQITTPDQFVISDDLAIPFEARRKVPPRLSDPSRIVIQSGYVTDELAIRIASGQRVDVVIFWTERFQENLPQFTGWVTFNYHQTETFDEDEFIYFDHYTKESTQTPK